MESFSIFVSLIIIVFGVLQIILFFKFWKMTEDIKRIKSNLVDGADASIDTAKKEIMLGNNEKAFEIYNKCFITDITEIYNKEEVYVQGKYGVDKVKYEDSYQNVCKKYQKELSRLGSQYSIDYSRFDTVEKMNAIIQ